MTPFLLQDELCKEIENVCSHMKFKSPDSHELQPLRAYKQYLPFRVNEDDPEHFPYAIVKLSDGSINSEEQDVNIVLMFGIYESDYDAQGHKYILNIINDIYQRFAENPILNGYYVSQDDMKWALDDGEIEEIYPYFFGGMSMQFKVSSFGREGSIYT